VSPRYAAVQQGERDVDDASSTASSEIDDFKQAMSLIFAPRELPSSEVKPRRPDDSPRSGGRSHARRPRPGYVGTQLAANNDEKVKSGPRRVSLCRPATEEELEVAAVLIQSVHRGNRVRKDSSLRAGAKIGGATDSEALRVKTQHYLLQGLQDGSLAKLLAGRSASPMGSGALMSTTGSDFCAEGSFMSLEEDDETDAALFCMAVDMMECAFDAGLESTFQGIEAVEDAWEN